jgi:hypothetical protein
VCRAPQPTVMRPWPAVYGKHTSLELAGHCCEAQSFNSPPFLIIHFPLGQTNRFPKMTAGVAESQPEVLPLPCWSHCSYCRKDSKCHSRLGQGPSVPLLQEARSCKRPPAVPGQGTSGFMPTIPATWETEIVVQGQLRQIVHKTPIFKITRTKWT